MKSIALLLVVFGSVLAAAAPVDFKPNPALDARWEKYKVDYKKVYKDAAEDAKRREIWERNVAIIDKQNSDFEKGLTTWTAGLNQFTDLTDEEKAASTNTGVKLPAAPLQMAPTAAPAAATTVAQVAVAASSVAPAAPAVASSSSPAAALPITATTVPTPGSQPAVQANATAIANATTTVPPTLPAVKP